MPPMAAVRWTSKPYSVATAARIARSLELSQATAQVLVRRGCATVEQARGFLAAHERHDEWRLGDMESACELILGHVRRGSRVVVHGDYDVDGVCSTAILIEALRALGTDPAWHLPSRLEGYGLSQATVERLADEGAGLLITADCGITAVAEVERAQERGLDVVVTDHHRPAERRPPCPVLHPALGSYPFPGLCAAGVAHKLDLALRARAGADPGGERALDLVALATVCDLVPLRGENRSLVREGLRSLARTGRPGLRALMRVAALDPGDIDERAVGFRLGPRLNAAGRLRRADAALELLITSDPGRAAEVAEELDLLNQERRDVETRILFAAEAARREQAHAPVYVIAGEGWHPGVVGIVASRMTERYHRPCLVIALDAGGGRGSGRSIAAFDLHAGLAACARHLRRFGGHRAAAGLEIDPERVEAFRRDLVRHASGVLSPADLVSVEEVDAVVPATALGLPLAEELRSLAPFGHGNPEPTLLVPAARVANVRPMGEDGQHARFTLVGSGSRAEAVSFRTTPASLTRDPSELQDAVLRLELNEWKGRVEARAVLSALCPVESGSCVPVEGAEPFWTTVERELDSGSDFPSAGQPPPAPAPDARLVSDRRGEGIAGVCGELLSSGEPVLVVCADSSRRREALEGLLAGLARATDNEEERPDLAVSSWPVLSREPELSTRYPHLVALDPPPSEDALRALAAAPAAGEPGTCQLAWGPAEVDFALAVARASLDLRRAMVELYRRLRTNGGAAGSELERLLRGDGPHPRDPQVCGRLLRVLLDLELIEYTREAAGGPNCVALERPRTALERSPAYAGHRKRLAETERYLDREAARWRLPAAAAGAS
jgi:single-stranded-DNA-specific exonuclease